MLYNDILRAIGPRFSGARADQQTAILTALQAGLEETLALYEINTPLRQAHFFAQCCHESAGFRATEEFADGSAYEGRKNLGNTQPGDGKRFKGRGLIQLTGRANYESFGKQVGVDLLANPSAAAEPAMSLILACEYWRQRGLNAYADRDDVDTITRRINGGLNGIDDRKAYLAKAKVLFGADIAIVTAAAVTATATAVHPTLRQGNNGPHVVSLQNRLNAARFVIAADGNFGPGTFTAAKQFQASKGLPADGVVGPATWAALG